MFGQFHFNIHTPPLTKDFEIFLTLSKMLFSLKTPEKFIHEHIPSESLQHESGRCKKLCFSASYHISYTSSGNFGNGGGCILLWNSENREHMPPVVFPAYASTRSPPSERCALLAIWTAGKGYKRSSNLRSSTMCVKVECFTLGVLCVYLFLSHGGSVRFIVNKKYERIGSSLGKGHIAARGKKRNVSLHKKYGNVYFIN